MPLSYGEWGSDTQQWGTPSGARNKSGASGQGAGRMGISSNDETWVPWTEAEIAAWVEEQRAISALRSGTTAVPVERAPRRVPVIKDVAHGNVRAYYDGCRCKPCTDAAAPWLKHYGVTK